MEEFRLKVINNEICRLCLNDKAAELEGSFDEELEFPLEPQELVEKFNIVEVG